MRFWKTKYICSWKPSNLNVHWVNTSTDWLLVNEGIIRLVVSVSALTWFYWIYLYRNLQLLNYVIIIQTKDLLHQKYMTWGDFGYMGLCPLVFLLNKTFKLLGFQLPMSEADYNFRENISRLRGRAQERWIVCWTINRWIVHYTIYQ
jgi:hypothetical protein